MSSDIPERIRVMKGRAGGQVVGPSILCAESRWPPGLPGAHRCDTSTPLRKLAPCHFHLAFRPPLPPCRVGKINITVATLKRKNHRWRQVW